MKYVYLSSLLLITLFLNSCSLALKRATNLYVDFEKKPIIFDAIIVPGVPLINGHWDSTMKARVLWSVYLYKNKITKNIIYSGGAIYTPYYEAKVMGLYAQQLGVPADHIFYDTLAKHSTENVYYSYKLAKILRFKIIALTTDPFQSALLKSFTRKRFTSKIQHLPVIFDSIKSMNGLNPIINYEAAHKEGFKSIVDSESKLHRLKGTLGRQLYFGPDNKLGPL